MQPRSCREKVIVCLWTQSFSCAKLTVSHISRHDISIYHYIPLRTQDGESGGSNGVASPHLDFFLFSRLFAFRGFETPDIALSIFLPLTNYKIMTLTTKTVAAHRPEKITSSKNFCDLECIWLAPRSGICSSCSIFRYDSDLFISHSAN